MKHFSIRHSVVGDLAVITLAEEKTGTEVAILPGYGATLHGFSVRLKGSFVNVVDSYKDRAELKKEMSKTFKGPKLSPFPCRIAEGKYSFGGQQYQFRNAVGEGAAIHGLLWDRNFALKSEDAGDLGASVVLEYDYKKENPAYPFEYKCLVQYTLHPDNLLEVRTQLINTGQETLPIADGWHPYFQLGGKIDGWHLQFHATAIVEFNEQLIPTGHILPYEAFEASRPIGDTFLDNSFVLNPADLHPACTLRNPLNGLEIAFYPDAGYPYLQIYTPPHRDSIAIENLSGAPDCFNNKMGLLLLAPGQSQDFSVKYKVSIG